jgi:hypothetical protein
MPLDEFVRLADPEKRALLIGPWSNPADMIDGIVCYQNENGSSEDWGNCYFVLFGPGPRCGGLTLEPLLTILHRGAGAIALQREGSRGEALEAYQVTTLVVLYFLPTIIRGFVVQTYGCGVLW